MALITEDGTARADAESFASVAAADAFHLSRGNVSWAAIATVDKEAALRRATDYLGQEYAMRWRGVRLTTTQALDWPRFNVQIEGRPYSYLLPNIVPPQVVQACCELSIRALSGPLAPDVGRVVKEKTTGPIKTVYADGAPPYTQFRSVGLLLAPLLGSKLKMVRG